MECVGDDRTGPDGCRSLLRPFRSVFRPLCRDMIGRWRRRLRGLGQPGSWSSASHIADCMSRSTISAASYSGIGSHSGLRDFARKESSIEKTQRTRAGTLASRCCSVRICLCARLFLEHRGVFYATTINRLKQLHYVKVGQNNSFAISANGRCNVLDCAP